MDNKLMSKNIELVDMHDLDAFIEQHLGRPWRVQGGEHSQDTLLTLEVVSDSESTAKVEEWLMSPEPQYHGWGRNETLYTEDLLSELCNRGLLPEGNLYVHIWW